MINEHKSQSLCETIGCTISNKDAIRVGGAAISQVMATGPADGWCWWSPGRLVCTMMLPEVCVEIDGI